MSDHRLLTAILLVTIPPLCAATMPSLCVSQPPPGIELQPVVSGLNSPVGVRHAGDASGRLFIVEQPGQISIWDGAQLLSPSFLDISALVDDSDNEQGLLGLAFHPDFESNGLFYVNYTFDPAVGGDRTRVASYQVSAVDPNLADGTSAITILEIVQPAGNHNGGNLAFGPDGFLYIGMGDGGGGGSGNAQDPTNLLGAMLRIDVDGSGPGDCGLEADYAIPPDNPYVATAGICDEIWAYGLRNPWRWSFDRSTGDLLIGDVGAAGLEEVNFQPASSSGGENYEWPCMEGTQSYSGTCSGPGTQTPPILQYGHDTGCAITGGYRYRGGYQPWQGTYVYADYCSGEIFFATETGGSWTADSWMDTSHSISSFGEDELGELYLLDIAGTLLRFDTPKILCNSFEFGYVCAWTDSIP